ncbi:hypothetical protein BHE74_00000474 [Ensete ventricosum]|nr:hypothetical protein BHE74_00000474 [Ensete ventricosum]
MPTSAAANDTGLRQARQPHPGCRVRNSAFAGAAVGTRLRKGGTAAGGRRSGLGTPFVRWKFQVTLPPKPANKVGDVRPGAGPPRVSARKLAAGIWHLQLLRDGNGNRQPPPGLEVCQDQDSTLDLLFLQWKTQLERARARITELETQRRSEKKELDRFLRRAAEEKASWRSREHEKVGAMIEAMKADLHKERKKRQRTEIVRARLIDEVAAAKLTAKQLLRDCEKERQARVLVEEVCDELGKEMGEDKAEIGTLKMEASRIREEAEDDKQMLQMAEVWREERVQMKLMEAKLTLEEKYSQLRELRAELEAFLSTSAAAHSDFALVREAELLKQKVDLVNTQGMIEFSYQPPPASEDIHAVFEELQPKQETHERDIKLCSGRSPETHASGESVDSKDDVEDEGDREKATRAEERGSSDSHVGIEPSVDDCCKESYASVSETGSKENRQDKVNQETIEVSSANAKSRKVMMASSSMCKLWSSSAHDVVDDLLRTSDEVKPSRLSNRTLSNGTLASYHDEVCEELSIERTTGGRPSNNSTLSPGTGLGEAGLCPAKGCTERPRSNQRHSLKAKLMGSQKIQLRHVLKQKV